LPNTPANLQVRITDKNGNPVKALSAPSTAGTHEIMWDGTNNSGVTMPPGTYRLSVAATTAEGSSIPVRISGLGMVSEIDMSTPDPVMFIGTRKLGLSEITGFKN
jgi:flagellar basal-body rod modification protein FlgD